MARKLILLTSFVLVLAMCSSTWAAGFNEPVDLALALVTPEGWVPWEATAKPGWSIWTPFDDTGEPHDAKYVIDVNGSGMNFGIASAPFGSHMIFQVSDLPLEVERICNSWLQNESDTTGTPDGDTHLALWGPGLLAGEYEVLIYHNRTDVGGDPCDPGYALMPRVWAQTYCEDNLMARYGRGNIDNIGAPLMPDCNVVVPMVNDVNVWVQSVTTDAELITSYVKFKLLETGASVHIICEAPPAGTACLNAFIVKAPSAPWAFSPIPGSGSENACPDVVLSWQAGTDANSVNGQDLYFSTDYNDVNDREAAAHIGLQTDTSYDPAGNLDWGQTYYWRVDSVNDPCMTPGAVWDFTVESGKARNPSPPDGGWSVEGTYVEWTPSCLATSHDIYYADNWDDVNDGSAYLMTWFSPWFDFGGITDPGKRYYWRIDENGPITFPDGDVWSYQMRGGPVVHFTFDGVPDANLPDPIEDDTNNVEFGRVYGPGSSEDELLTYGEANPLVNPLSTGAHFQPNMTSGAANALGRLVYGFDILDLDKDGYTIEMWLRQDKRTMDNLEDYFGGDDLAASLVRRYDLSYIVAIGQDGALRFAHSGEDNVIGTKAGAIALNEWVHVAAVYDGDGSDPCTEQKLYIGGELVVTGWAPNPNPYDDDDVTIGAAQQPRREGWPDAGNPFYGYIDELRISDIALLPPQFLIRGDRRLAWLPKPPHGKTKVPIDTMLLWNPGDLASSHDVYLGTSESDVNDANTSVTLGVFMGNREPNDYDPGGLALDKTYYWRIDEVNDTNGATFKGGVWRFTTAGYVVIDDFEQYDNQNDRIYYTWDDGQINGSGSYIDLGVAPRDPVYDGEQSMLCVYDNQINWGYGAYVSEVSRLVDFTNWNSLGLKVLTVHFYGDPVNDANETEEPYAGVEDGTYTYAEARYGDEGHDIKDLEEDEWHAWDIPLSRFTDGGADLNDVVTIYIGLGDRTNNTTAGGYGVVYFDEIWLQVPICVPEEGPLYDLSGNCVVDWADVGIVGEEWLAHDLDFRPPVAPSGLVAHWALDGNANDSSGTNHGVAEGEYAYVDGRIGANSIEFTDDISDDGGRVLVPDAPALTPAAEVTVAAWLNPTEGQEDSARVLVKGGDNTETYAIQMSNDTPNMLLRDPCGDGHGLDSNADLEEDEWTHIAGTYDGDVGTFYVNARVTNSADMADFSPVHDSNGLAIGNRSDAMDKAYIGKIDDVQIYNVALSQAEIVYIVSEGSGYLPVDSPAELHTSEPEGQRAVNIRDLAELLTKWLESKYWPN